MQAFVTWAASPNYEQQSPHPLAERTWVPRDLGTGSLQEGGEFFIVARKWLIVPRLDVHGGHLHANLALEAEVVESQHVRGLQRDGRDATAESRPPACEDVFAKPARCLLLEKDSSPTHGAPRLWNAGTKWRTG